MDGDITIVYHIYVSGDGGITIVYHIFRLQGAVISPLFIISLGFRGR